MLLVYWICIEMAKKEVTWLLNDLASRVIREVETQKPKDPRGLINARPHIYSMEYESLVQEVSDQVEGIFAVKDAPRVEINPYRKKVIEKACRAYFDRVSSSMSKGQSGFAVDVLQFNKNNFTIRIQSVNNSSSVYKSFIDGKRAPALKALKDTLELELILDEQERGAVSRIQGYEKNSERIGGLLDIGHVEGYSIAEKRVQFLLEKLEAKANTSSKRTTKRESPLFKILAQVRTNPRISNIKTIRFEGDILVREQGVDSNRRVQAAKEFALVNSIKKQITALAKDMDWANFSSSPSAMDIVKHELISTAKRRGAKTKAKTKKASKSSYKATSSIKKETISTQIEKDSGVTIKGRRKTSDKEVPRKQNWLQLLPVINARLTDQVMRNMNTPRLVNRTGRFAQSARVVGVEQTRQGFPSFVFDYERDPYNVFDRTVGRAPWNTPQRDPRSLVDISIREIVREMAIGRFFTRRA
jgi:hypothetical protein